MILPIITTIHDTDIYAKDKTFRLHLSLGRFKLDLVIRRPKLRVGDTRTISRFALFPTKVDGKVIWFKRYSKGQQYTKLIKFSKSDKPHQVKFTWKTITENINGISKSDIKAALEE